MLIIFCNFDLWLFCTEPVEEAGGGAFPELTLRKGPFRQKIQPSLPKTSLLLPALASALTVEF